MGNVYKTNELNKANELINSLVGEKNVVKRIKNEKGLIEKSDKKEKIVLVEDNRQIICG